MKHILMIITRMNEGEGDVPDEFVERWGGRNDSTKKCLLFSQRDTQHEYVVLIIQGAEFADDPPEAAAKAVLARIRACLEETFQVSGESLKAVMFHPPNDWIPEDRRMFTKLLQQSELDLQFVKEYRGVTESIKTLAEKCRANIKFTGDFAAICREQRAEHLKQLFSELALLIKPVTMLAYDLADTPDLESLLEQYSCDLVWLSDARRGSDPVKLLQLLANTASAAKHDCNDVNTISKIAQIEENLKKMFGETNSRGQLQSLLDVLESSEEKQSKLAKFNRYGRDFQQWYAQITSEMTAFEILLETATNSLTSRRSDPAP